MTWTDALVLAVGAVVVVGVVLLATDGLGPDDAGDGPTRPPPDAPIRVENTTSSSFDGHEVPLTVYRVDDGSARPTLLWGHGWSSDRSRAADDGRFFAAHGYNVVAMDFRGHGDAAATSQAHLHSFEYEIRDVRAVIDWIAQQPWAAIENTPNATVAPDPVLGALGGSYGGGYQLLTATVDDRLDAIAPQITWNSLPRGLAPNGAIRGAWLNFLYGSAQVRGTTMAPEIETGFREALTYNRVPDGEPPTTVDLLTPTTAASPSSYPDAITVPTLLVQGMPDTLFNLNEAVANYRQIADDAPVYLFTHLGGHILNTNGTLDRDEVPEGTPGVGFQPPEGDSPCGDVRQVVLAFYDDVLMRGLATATGLPRVSLAVDDGSCLEVSDWPPAPGVHIEVDGPLPAPSGPAGPPLMVPLTDGGEEVRLAGIPRVNGTVVGVGADAISYWSLVAIGPGGQRVLDSQVTPLRLTGPALGSDFELELGGVASVIAPEERLFLSVATSHEQYATSAGRTPDGAVFTDLVVTLPILGAEA